MQGYFFQKPFVKGYEFQDTHQEQIIHSGWEYGNAYRNVLEGTGDIYRELTQETPTLGYIGEKTRRIREYINNTKTYIHPDDTFEYAYEHNKDKFEEMIKLWEQQPYKTEAQHNAIKLNLAMLNKDYTGAERLIGQIESVFNSAPHKSLPMTQTNLPKMLGVGKGWHKESARHREARFKGINWDRHADYKGKR